MVVSSTNNSIVSSSNEQMDNTAPSASEIDIPEALKAIDNLGKNDIQAPDPPGGRHEHVHASPDSRSPVTSSSSTTMDSREEDLSDFNTKLEHVDTPSVSTTKTTQSYIELEADYDKKPTPLYMMIQAKDWEGALQRAEYFPEEARVFIYRRGGGSDKNQIRWRLLPLHAALLMAAPPSVIQALCDAFPRGAQCPDDTADLPIHLAVRKHVDEETLNLLLQAYPDSIDARNGEGYTPLDLASKTTSHHKTYYMGALKRGELHSKITANIFTSLLCGLTLPEFNPEEMEEYKKKLEKMIEDVRKLDAQQVQKCLEGATEEVRKINPAQMAHDLQQQTNVLLSDAICRATTLLGQTSSSSTNDGNTKLLTQEASTGAIATA